MGACLGVYLGERIIKYAKLEQDEKTRIVNLISYGTKYVLGEKHDAVSEIIKQTGSEDASLYVNIEKSNMIETEVLKQLKKTDVQSVIALEVSDSASQMGVSDKTLEHRYTLVDSTVSSSNSHALVEIVDKKEIKKYFENKDAKQIAGLYPIQYILNKITTNQDNYILLNINEETTIMFVSNNVPVAIKTIDVSMKPILDSLAVQEGSYAKACNLCRNINVLSEENLDNDLESIIEPTVQDLLNRVRTVIEESKFKCEKIVLNGLINLFINIEVLFEQYFGIEAEKLKPDFLKLDENSINMPEVIEANEAIALAYECLTQSTKEMNFYMDASSVATTAKGKFDVKDLFNLKRDGTKKPVVLPNIEKSQIEKALLFSNLTAASLLVGYGAFTAIYNGTMTSLEDKLNSNINTLSLETSKVTTDIKYIDGIKDKYTKYNNYISTTVAKIREGKIGKYTTYNVASFMQKIARYIPTNVELQSISSNDNKTVNIVAKSTSYAELGYFISQLKLKGVLENVKTGNIEHGSYITVTIGGDLP